MIHMYMVLFTNPMGEILWSDHANTTSTENYFFLHMYVRMYCVDEKVWTFK